MKVSGFSYVRNGFTYGYPFLQSIRSVLPVCDEFVIAVGDSNDGTREAIAALDPKIRIVDTVWDESLRQSGKIFAQQANEAMAAATGDWLFHIQADEVIHEKDHPVILDHIRSIEHDKRFDGLLFDFLNFYGTYDYLNNTRYQHKKEIRIFRNHINAFSYRDSQGFRKYPSYQDYLAGHKGIKLRVKDTHVPVFHYNFVRSPRMMQVKARRFDHFYTDDKTLQEKYEGKAEANIYNIERVKQFTGTHPAVMKDLVAAVDWEFDPSKVHRELSLKDKVAYFIEDIIKYRIGEYKNYIIAR